MHWEEKGAYTGEISAQMLKSIGIEYVIIGHSERRQYFAETDETVNKKVKAALLNGLKPIVCVGETLEQREQGKQKEIITNQTHLALEGLNEEQLKSVMIAYEPIWAIGTGKTATSEEFENGYFKGHTTNYIVVKVPEKEENSGYFVNQIIPVKITDNTKERELIGKIN